MKIVNVIIVFLSFIKLISSQESNYLQSQYVNQDVTQLSDATPMKEDPDSESVREKRTFLRRKFCRKHGLFGRYRGHQGHYSHGHYQGPSGFDNYDNFDSYGSVKPGLSYSIGNYGKGSSYGSSSYSSGYNSENYNSKPSYGSGSFGSYSDYTSDKGKYTDLYKGKHKQKGNSKHLQIKKGSGHSKDDSSTESNSSEEDEDEEKPSKKLLKHKESLKEDKGIKQKESSAIPLPLLPVVSQPVVYIPQISTIPVIQSIIQHGDPYSSYSTYIPGSCGGSTDYTASTCTNPTYHSVPITSASSNYLTPAAIISPTSYSSIPYSTSYPSVQDSPAYSTLVMPSAPPHVSTSYATAAPVYQNSPTYQEPTMYSSPNPLSMYPYPSCPECSRNPPQYTPSYTGTNFDFQTISTSYQPNTGKDIRTIAKSGTSIASSNVPPGYIASAFASSPPNNLKKDLNEIVDDNSLKESSKDIDQDPEADYKKDSS